jgi:hypothetical protein
VDADSETGWTGVVMANLYRDDDTSNNFYVMLIHVDLNDAAPDFDQYYYVDWSALPGQLWGWQSAPTYYVVDYWAWFCVGPNYKQLPPWTTPYAKWQLCLLDYSYLSTGKILALDYMYYQILSQDVNAVGDRAEIEFHISKDLTG